MSVGGSYDGEDGPGDEESVLMQLFWGEVADYIHKIGIEEAAHENKWEVGIQGNILWPREVFLVPKEPFSLYCCEVIVAGLKVHF